MAASPGSLGVDWLAVCRRAAERVRTTLARYPTSAERAVETGRGEGGDTALVIDRAAEDAVLEELDALGVPLTVVSEERGELTLAGGGPVHVVVDPIDGSLNAKRGLPFASVSIAVAGGPALPDVDFGYVAALDPEREWWAERGGGAFADGERLRPLAPGPLEILGLETARPELVAKAAPALASLNARRIRAIGSVAVTLAFVADGSLDAMLSLRSVRSVDAAAGVLLVEEAGGVARYADVAGHPPLGLGMRSRVFAARDQSMLDSLLVEFPLWISSGPDGERGPGWQG